MHNNLSVITSITTFAGRLVIVQIENTIRLSYFNYAMNLNFYQTAAIDGKG